MLVDGCDGAAATGSADTPESGGGQAGGEPSRGSDCGASHCLSPSHRCRIHPSYRMAHASCGQPMREFTDGWIRLARLILRSSNKCAPVVTSTAITKQCTIVRSATPSLHANTAIHAPTIPTHVNISVAIPYELSGGAAAASSNTPPWLTRVCMAAGNAIGSGSSLSHRGMLCLGIGIGLTSVVSSGPSCSAATANRPVGNRRLLGAVQHCIMKLHAWSSKWPAHLGGRKSNCSSSGRPPSWIHDHRYGPAGSKISYPHWQVLGSTVLVTIP